ncbi:MAG: iron chelate uptake ABC transporter family permease subunit [Marinomonas sp.]
MRDKRILGLLIALITVVVVLFSWNLTTHVRFILELRAIKLGGLLVVGAAIGISTVLFQTISNNRVLTPSIMGFDALFLLVQACLIFFLSGITYAHLPSDILFFSNALLMLVASVALFSIVLKKTRHDIQLMILVGVIFGLVFRAFTSFIQRLIDPSEFAILQSVMFAQFGGISRTELLCALSLLVLVCVWGARKCKVLDVMLLGRRSALSLGVDYDRLQFMVLCAISILVSISTALVGPIVFLGLLVSVLAHSLMKTHQHALLLPASAMISALILLLGQALFEHVLERQSTLTVVIEFVGGLFFLILLSKGKIK